jgi:hypothetical protein
VTSLITCNISSSVASFFFILLPPTNEALELEKPGRTYQPMRFFFSFAETSRPAKNRRKRKGAAGGGNVAGGGPGGGGGAGGGGIGSKKRSPGPNFSLASQVFLFFFFCIETREYNSSHQESLYLVSTMVTIYITLAI